MNKTLLLEYLECGGYALGVLATQDNSGPYTCNIFFGWDEDCNLYFVSAERRTHSGHIQNNSKVAVSFVDTMKYDLASSDKKGIQLRGECTMLKGEEVDAAYEYYCKNILSAREQISLSSLKEAGGQRIWKVKITWGKIWDEEKFSYEGKIV